MWWSERKGQLLSRQPARGLGGVPWQGGAGIWVGLLETWRRRMWDNLREQVQEKLGSPSREGKPVLQIWGCVRDQLEWELLKIFWTPRHEKNFFVESDCLLEEFQAYIVMWKRKVRWIIYGHTKMFQHKRRLYPVPSEFSSLLLTCTRKRRSSELCRQRLLLFIYLLIYFWK